MLKFMVKSLDELEDPSQSTLYAEQEDGSFLLQVEGVKPVADFDNVTKALKSERKLRSDWEKKAKSFGEDTPESLQKMRDKIAELEASSDGGNDEGQKRLKEHYEAKIAAIQEDNRTKLSERDALIKEKDDKLVDFRLTRELQEMCGPISKPESLNDALVLLKSGVTLDADTDEFVASDGVTPLKDHVSVFFKERPYFVRESTGGGASNGKGSTGPTDWTKLNMTDQAKLMRENPTLAEKLRRKAGMIT